MAIKYVHTNIISKDWKKLAGFYIDVFGCTKARSETHLSGEWLEKGTGVKGAKIEGVHLLLPGYGKDGPTLEIFQYNEVLGRSEISVANRQGFLHIAFHVDSVEKTLNAMIEHGGEKVGEIVAQEYSRGTLTFTYARDPEGNLIELQTWQTK